MPDDEGFMPDLADLQDELAEEAELEGVFLLLKRSGYVFYEIVLCLFILCYPF